MKRSVCLALSSALLIAACSEAGLQPVAGDKGKVVDNKLELRGSVCTSDPTEVNFPVKVMFIVDASGSMQFTDPSDANTITNVSSIQACTSSKDCPNNGACTAGICPAQPDKATQSCLQSCGSVKGVNCTALCSNVNSPGRQAAVQKVIDRFKNNPAVEFAIIRFNARVTVNGGEQGCEGFTNKTNCIKKGLDSLTQAEIFTDYQGAFSKAYQVLESDMLNVSPVERSRTKYVLIFLSDGAPDPQCQKGCGNDFYLGQVYSWCDAPRDQWCDNYYISGSRCDFMKTWYPSMKEPCKAYNSEQQIIQRVNEIMDLGKQYAVGEIRIHSAFLFVPGLPKAILDLIDGSPDATIPGSGSQAKCKVTADCSGGERCWQGQCGTPWPLKDRAEKLVQKIAKAGDGLYRNFTNGQQIDFLDINYASVARPFGLTNIIVTNMNARPDGNRLAIDSDGDGITDLKEYDVRLNMRDATRDTDGDGYNDKLELDRYKAGFHPGDPKIPAKRCIDRLDLDGDGLNGCEEKILGTDPKIPDSDRDRIPDGLEFFWGTDPLKNDAKSDGDFDGKLSGQEIIIHSDPIVADPEIHANFRYIYDVREQPERPDRKKCYDFTVRNVRLVTTKGVGAGTQGINEIMVYFGEGPSDDPRDYGNFKAACVRAQYVEPSFKDPADGQVTLTPDDFMDLPALLKAKANAKIDPKSDPCVGAKLK